MGVVSLCRKAIGVFCSPSRLGRQKKADLKDARAGSNNTIKIELSEVTKKIQRTGETRTQAVIPITGCKGQNYFIIKYGNGKNRKTKWKKHSKRITSIRRRHWGYNTPAITQSNTQKSIEFAIMANIDSDFKNPRLFMSVGLSN